MSIKNILLISTGGTIACTESADGYVPTMGGGELLSYVPGAAELARFEALNVLNVDSSNMQPEDWVLIARAIRDRAGDYDGVIVLHGTDTMAYTSSAVSFMTVGLEIPVVFTGAQIPIQYPDSDGRRNLMDAVRVVCEGDLAGVFIVFAGKIMSGCCASKIDTSSMEAFQSINRRELGCVRDGAVQIFSRPAAAEGPRWHIAVDKRVLLWKLTPGISPDFFDRNIADNYRVIILEAFGVGGLPMLKNSFLPKILEWRRQGILTVVTTQCYYGRCNMSIYETGRLALNEGAVCAGNMTREALLTKLMWILSMTEDTGEIVRWLGRDCCGEFGVDGDKKI